MLPIVAVMPTNAASLTTTASSSRGSIPQTAFTDVYSYTCVELTYIHICMYIYVAVYTYV